MYQVAFAPLLQLDHANFRLIRLCTSNASIRSYSRHLAQAYGPSLPAPGTACMDGVGTQVLTGLRRYLFRPGIWTALPRHCGSPSFLGTDKVLAWATGLSTEGRGAPCPMQGVHCGGILLGRVHADRAAVLHGIRLLAGPEPDVLASSPPLSAEGFLT